MTVCLQVREDASDGSADSEAPSKAACQGVIHWSVLAEMQSQEQGKNL